LSGAFCEDEATATAAIDRLRLQTNSVFSAVEVKRKGMEWWALMWCPLQIQWWLGEHNVARAGQVVGCDTPIQSLPIGNI